jgi:hypothetical protein
VDHFSCLKVDHFLMLVDTYHATIFGKVLSATRPRKFFNDEGPRPKTVELRCVRPPGFEKLTASGFSKRVLDAITEVLKAAFPS